MDRNSPDFYIEDTRAGVEDAEAFIRHALQQSPAGTQFLQAVDQEAGAVTEEGMNKESVADSRWFDRRPTLLNTTSCPLLLPIITPRFVPTCTPGMMNRLGYLAYKYGLPVQSHLSENLGENAWVRELHPDCSTYAGVYRQHHLLHSGTALGHACFSGREEREVLRGAGAGVVHCAASNFNLNSGNILLGVYVIVSHPHLCRS